jgi:Na+/melibiose symporter-like transporter
MVGTDRLLEANSKTQATQSVSEVGAFGISGWLVQALTGPGAVLLDAASFVVSALLLRRVKLREAEAPVREEHPGMREEVRDGLRILMRQPELQAVAISSTMLWFGFRLCGTVISLYALEDLGFEPGVLGMIYGVGGVTSFFGALLAEPLARRFGVGPAMIVGLFMGALSLATVPLAQGAGWVAAALLVAQQSGDGFVMVYMINETTMRQALAPAAFMGRVNATSVFLTQSAMVVGIVVAGGLGEVAGLRATLATGAAVAMASALWLAAGPVRRLRTVDAGHVVERVE